jgi:hypothetical protein
VSTVQALLVFGGIPIAFAALVYLLVSASSWTRSGRAGSDYGSGPFLVSSAAALPNPSRLASDLPASGFVEGGGVSARW